MTGFDGEVLAITIPMRDFVYYYGAFMDTVVETYSVAGMFSDEVPFVTEGAVTLRGHLSGDVNLDGIVDISDITYLVAYIFGGGPVPRLLLSSEPSCHILEVFTGPPARRSRWAFFLRFGCPPGALAPTGFTGRV
jgi:hypothetical protein